MGKEKGGSRLPLIVMPMIALLANITIKPKKEEGAGNLSEEGYS